MIDYVGRNAIANGSFVDVGIRKTKNEISSDCYHKKNWIELLVKIHSTLSYKQVSENHASNFNV